MLLFMRKHKMPLIMTLNERYFYHNINAITKNKNDAIPLKSLTKFDWDKVCYYTPYSPTEETTYLDFYRAGEKVATIYGFQKTFIKKFGTHCSFAALEQAQECLTTNVKVYLKPNTSFCYINLAY